MGKCLVSNFVDSRCSLLHKKSKTTTLLAELLSASVPLTLSGIYYARTTNKLLLIC